MDPGPVNYSPSYIKVASFFEHGAVSGAELDQAEQELAQKTGSNSMVCRSYDDQSKGLSLNCISSLDGIRYSLFGSAANGGLSIAVEEKRETGGIIDEVYSRLETAIETCERTAKAFISDPTALKQVSLKQVIFNDETFLAHLRDKIGRTVLFIFDLKPENDEANSTTGARETIREKVFPEHIKWVLIPSRYKDGFIEENKKENKLPLDKIIFVENTRVKNFHFSYTVRE